MPYLPEGMSGEKGKKSEASADVSSHCTGLVQNIYSATVLIHTSFLTEISFIKDTFNDFRSLMAAGRFIAREFFCRHTQICHENTAEILPRLQHIERLKNIFQTLLVNEFLS